MSGLTPRNYAILRRLCPGEFTPADYQVSDLNTRFCYRMDELMDAAREDGRNAAHQAHARALRDLVEIAERVDRIHAPAALFGALSEAREALREQPKPRRPTILQRIRDVAERLYHEGKDAGRVELTAADRGLLNAEVAAIDGRLTSDDVMIVHTEFGTVRVATADRAAMCWRRHGRSYGTDTWEREPL